MQKLILALTALVIFIGIGFGVKFWVDQRIEKQHRDKFSFVKTDDVSYRARIQDDYFEVYENNEWKQIPIKGVNIGMAKPGAFPGEAAITKTEYKKWFEQIGEMNANTIRIYTLHPPAFYEALEEHNKEHEEPLYLFHGVWIDEGPLEETLDASDPEITENFQKEFKKIVDVIHGNQTVEKQPGHAHGTYDADVSAYTIGWMIGIEWYPYMAENMIETYKNQADYNGIYLKTNQANGMEDWLAEQLDVLANYEIETYKQMRPLSFTNWVSTDLLDHPAEPDEKEDLASIDPNALEIKGIAEKVGMFASYHVYPYYPDFLNLEEKYVNFEDHRGEPNNYAGYLADLQAAHDMPIIIAEFGIPAARGMTHRNVHGANQGFTNEKEQGEHIVRMHEDIMESEMLGGLVFSWQDEWFKRTWNTMDLDNPDRRPFWSNSQTNEERFGLLSFDQEKIKLDGNKADWNEGKLLYENSKNESLTSIQADHDEQFFYLRADFDEPFDEETTDLQFYFNLHNEFGNTQDDRFKNMIFNKPQQFALTVSSQDQASMEIDPYYASYEYLYGYDLKLLDDFTEAPKKNSKQFTPILFALNKEFVHPVTKELVPFEAYETGVFRHGNSNPESEDFDSLADYFITNDGKAIEVRIPWLLLNFKDPSTHEVIGDLYSKDGVQGVESVIKTDGIGVTAVLTTKEGPAESFPAFKKKENTLTINAPKIYEWDAWDLPKSKPRLKKSYGIVRDYFENVQ